MKMNRFLAAAAASVLAFAIGVSLPALAGARDVKSGGGARNNVTSGANRDSNANRNVNTNRNVNANSNTNVNRNTNINRDTNVNRNTNVNVNSNRNINVDVDHHGCCDNDWDDHHHPIATGVAIGATAAITSAVIGSMVTTLPPACQTTVINGVGYSNCGGTWYQPQYVGTSVQYVVVAPMR